MREVIRAICAMVVLGLPIGAAAQGANAFDGTYRGVSISVEKYGGAVGRCPAPSRPTPANLIIANGVVRGGPFDGTITPQGVLRMRTERAFVIGGRIDPQGNVRAQGSGGVCVWNYVWQKG
jgi:hypothetical protein